MKKITGSHTKKIFSGYNTVVENTKDLLANGLASSLDSLLFDYEIDIVDQGIVIDALGHKVDIFVEPRSKSDTNISILGWPKGRVCCTPLGRTLLVKEASECFQYYYYLTSQIIPALKEKSFSVKGPIVLH